jgi:acyl transferase domain-containing protein
MENALLSMTSYLLERQEFDSRPFLDDLAYTLCSRRSLFTRRVAYHAATVPELIQSMNGSPLKLPKVPRTPRLGFVFTGQGAQWHAMGRELIDTYPTFKRSLLLANDHFSELGAQWNVIGKFTPHHEFRRKANIQ